MTDSKTAWDIKAEGDGLARRPSTEGPVHLAVLMSVYSQDQPELFRRALRSIIDQDYKGGAIHLYLCVDGTVGSEIEDIIESHSRHIFKVVRNATNQGLARSLNTLLGHLKDEAFIFRMDSDDFSHPARFTRQIEEMLRRPELDILGSAINEVDETGNLVRKVTYPKELQDIYRMLPRRNPLAHPTVCFRKRAIDNFGQYPVTPINQDWALWFKCMKLGLNLSSMEEVLVDMTVSDNFFKRRGASRASDEFRITMEGTHALHGVTWRMIFPILRYLFRLCPPAFIRFAYNSRLR